MDTAYITGLEEHFMAVVQEMIGLDGSFKNHVDFARAAFGDEVSNCNGKWSRLRSNKNNLTLSDIARISAALNTSPATLFTLAEYHMRKTNKRIGK